MNITERQKEILKLASQGCKNLVIASELDISENTVKYHKKQLFKVLKVRSMNEALFIAMKNGII